MENIMNRIAYLEGLAEGFGISSETKEGKLLLEIIDVLADMAEEVRISREEIEEYVDVIEEDLSTLEEYVYEDEDEDFDDFDLYDDDYDFDDFDDFEELDEVEEDEE